MLFNWPLTCVWCDVAQAITEPYAALPSLRFGDTTWVLFGLRQRLHRNERTRPYATSARIVGPLAPR